MAITRGQVAGSGHGGTGGFGAQTVNLPGAVTAGQLLVCLWVGNSNTGNATCADNINGAWTALTQQSPFAGSGRRMNWFYKLNSAAASAGALTVTVTPVANAGNSEWMQVATYNGVGGYDSAVSAYSTWSGAAATYSQVSGIPTQTGDLILYGMCSNNESTQTFAAISPMTAMVFDGSGLSAGKGANQMPLAFDELLGASTSAVTAAMSTSGAADDGGRWVIGFSPSTGSVITKTQTATARIANTVTKTQTATARVANSKTKTQSSIARIANSKTKTQTAIARIARNITKTQTAIARVAKTVTKTQSATARIVGTVTKTQSATARIANSKTKTQTAIARVANTTTKTQSATARIAKTVTKTQSAVARIVNNLTKTQSATARIANTTTKTQSAIARIGQTATKTQSAVARIAKTTTKTQSATSRIATSVTKTQSARAKISNNLYKQQTATARIVQTTFSFSPPVTQGPSRYTGRVRELIWRHYRGQMTGVTVLKNDGVYTEVETPLQSQISAADIAYMGGHTYDVSAEEAADLEAAGYEITLGVNG